MEDYDNCDLGEKFAWLDKTEPPADYIPGKKAEYVLSYAESTVIRLKEKGEHERLLREANDSYQKGDALQAIRLVDEAMAKSGFETSYEALRLRAQYGFDLPKVGVKNIIQLSVSPETEPDDGNLNEKELSQFPDAVQEIEKRLNKQLNEYVGDDCYTVSKRIYVSPIQYSRNGRFFLVSTSMTEERDSPAAADIETTDWCGGALIDTASGEIVYYDDSLMKHNDPYTACPDFELRINNDGSRILKRTGTLLSIIELDTDNSNRKIWINHEYLFADFLEDDHYLLCLDTEKNIHVINSEDGSIICQRKLQLKDCFDLVLIDNNYFKANGSICWLVWDYETKQTLKDDYTDIKEPDKEQQGIIKFGDDNSKVLSILEKEKGKKAGMVSNSKKEGKKKGFFSRLFGKK